jgi:hypothetical protein
MGSWTVVIQGTGAQHNFTRLDSNRPVPDGEGDYERRHHDADYRSVKFVREPNQKRLPLAERAGHAERSENRCESWSCT